MENLNQLNLIIVNLYLELRWKAEEAINIHAPLSRNDIVS